MFSLRLHPNPPSIASFEFVGFSALNQPQFTASFTDKSAINGIRYFVKLFALKQNGSCPIADEFSVSFQSQVNELVLSESTQLPTTVNPGFCLNAYFLIFEVSTGQVISSARANASNI